MELKYFLVLSTLGLVSGFSLPDQRESNPVSHLDSSLPSNDNSSPSATTRDKRHLLLKLKKGGGGGSYGGSYGGSHGGSYGGSHGSYQHGSSYIEQPTREIHHYHHYSQQPAASQYQESHYVGHQSAPSQGYQQYHGSSGGAYSKGGAYSSGGFGGGYSGGYNGGHNGGGYGVYSGGPSGGGSYYQPSPSGPAQPWSNGGATAYNGVDRGQGAAAVNNIAIIHARAGSSSSSSSSSSSASDAISKVLPKPLGIDFGALTGDSHHHHDY